MFEAARDDVCRFLGIADLPWHAEDVVLTSAVEHHALIRPVEQLAGRGVRHLVAPYRPGLPLERAEAFFGRRDIVVRAGQLRRVGRHGRSARAAGGQLITTCTPAHR